MPCVPGVQHNPVPTGLLSVTSAPGTRSLPQVSRELRTYEIQPSVGRETGREPRERALI